MADNDNLKLWNEVQKTDPTYTKDYSGPGGYSGTAISGNYMIMEATKQFGPIGLGWGYDIIEDRIDTGGPVYSEADGSIMGHTMTHTIKLELWVKFGDEVAKIQNYGHTPYVTWNRNYKNWNTDQEAPKKSLTDAIKKCLSMFGFCADIYLGLYDDVSYVEEVKAQAQIDKADDKLEATVKANQVYKEWFDKHLEIIKTAASVNELELIFKSSYRKAQRKQDRDGLLTLTRAKDARLKTLEDKKNGSTTPAHK